jgi:hypothetical protein
MAKVSKNRNNNQHVIPMGTGWAVKGESSTEFFVVTETQTDAIKVARKLAKNTGTELVIHSRTGHIRDRVSYAPATVTIARKK